MEIALGSRRIGGFFKFEVPRNRSEGKLILLAMVYPVLADTLQIRNGINIMDIMGLWKFKINQRRKPPYSFPKALIMLCMP